MAPKIHTPAAGFTGVVVGVPFTDGVGETTDAAALSYFERHGYKVEQVAPTFPDGDPAEAWKVAELKQWAAAHDVDLGSATKKDDVWAAIVAATAADSAGEPADPGAGPETDA